MMLGHSQYRNAVASGQLGHPMRRRRYARPDATALRY